MADAPRLRDLFLARMKASRGAGLGDERAGEREPAASGATAWTPSHIIALREMLEEARRMNVVVR